MEIAEAEFELESRKYELQKKQREEEYELQKKKKEDDLAMAKRAREESIASLRNDPKAIVDFYRDTFTSFQLTFDDKDRLFLKDAISNAMHPERGKSDDRIVMPISDIYRVVTGKVGKKEDWIRIGRLAAAEYRRRNGGRNPPQSERLIDGTTRLIYCYTGADSEAWLKDLILDNATRA